MYYVRADCKLLVILLKTHFEFAILGRDYGNRVESLYNLRINRFQAFPTICASAAIFPSLSSDGTS